MTQIDISKDLSGIYTFGERLTMDEFENKEKKSGVVFLHFDFPVFPMPNGNGFSRNPKDLLEFVFGKNVEQSDLLAGMKVEVYPCEKNSESHVYGGHYFKFLPENIDSCTHSQVMAAADALYDYIYSRIGCIRVGLMSAFEDSHKLAKERHPILYALNLVSGHEGPSWLSPCMYPDDKKPFIQTYMDYKRVRHDIFEPVPGREGRDDHGQSVRLTEINRNP
jgi:hypothetical protein